MRLSAGLAGPSALAAKPTLINTISSRNRVSFKTVSKCFIAPLKPHIVIVSSTSRRLAIVAAAGDATTNSPPVTATACIETGLKQFEQGDAQGALKLFQRALELNPNDDEARAALYNSACAFTKLKRWDEAANAVISAVNDRNLKLAVALRDPDLAQLRERREWTAALGRVTGGISNNSYVKLRAEAKAPLRLPRIFLFSGLAAGAGLGLLIITARLVAAARGGDGAPDLQESIQNFAINSGALALFIFLLIRDFKGQGKDQIIVEREEKLANLQVNLGPGRTVSLAAFRGSTRPIILTGSKGQINKALASAEPFRQELRLRGISLVPVVFSEEDPGEKLRKLKAELAAESLIGGSSNSSASSSSQPQGFASTNTSTAAAAAASNTSKASTSGATNNETDKKLGSLGQVSKEDRRWQLTPANLEEWSEWVSEQTKSAGITSPGDNYYVQVQMDGSVRASGAGIPPWKKFLDDIPPLDDVRTKFMDGGNII
jgi:tetratricopeptide (TPR) repeat protein